jgi:hypothetical protein
MEMMPPMLMPPEEGAGEGDGAGGGGEGAAGAE